MRRTIALTLLVLTGLILLAGTAVADTPSGPWGNEDPDTWCQAHGDYSDPARPTFPAECSAYWHPTSPEPTAEPHNDPAPEPKHVTLAPKQRAAAPEIIPPRVWLAETGPSVTVAVLAIVGAALLVTGIVIRRAAA